MGLRRQDTFSADGEVMTVQKQADVLQVEAKERFITRADVAFMFHACALLFYVRTWLWHTSPAAAILPGAQGFGWFFRYLTFCSFTAQMVQMGICCLAHVSRSPKRKQRLTAASDDLSCALFGIVNTVTGLFFAIEKSTKGLVEGGALERPPWLNIAVHVANSGVAWADLLVAEERSFSGSSRRFALLFATVYCCWLLLVRQGLGKFPYPILNNLPFPAGYLGFVLLGFAVVLATFHLGKAVRRLLDGGVGSGGDPSGPSPRAGVDAASAPEGKKQL